MSLWSPSVSSYFKIHLLRDSPVALGGFSKAPQYRANSYTIISSSCSMAPSLLSFAVAVLLLRTADAACNAADPVSAMTYGCCLQANNIAEGACPCRQARVLTCLSAAVWVDSGVATDGTPTNTAGVDNSNCGSTAAPCLSIKWAYHVRVANGGTVKVKGGRKYTGANNRYVL